MNLSARTIVAATAFWSSIAAAEHGQRQPLGQLHLPPAFTRSDENGVRQPTIGMNAEHVRLQGIQPGQIPWQQPFIHDRESPR